MGLEVAARLGDWSWQADLKANLGEDYVYTGRFDEAEELLQEAFDNAKKGHGHRCDSLGGWDPGRHVSGIRIARPRL